MSKQEVVLVNQGDLIPCDGTVVEGIALVDESAVAGFSQRILIDDKDGQNTVVKGGVIVDGWLKVMPTSECSPEARTEAATPKADVDPDNKDTGNTSAELPCPATSKVCGDPILRAIFVLTLCVASTMICAFLGYAFVHTHLAAVIGGLVGLAIGASQSW